MDISKLTVAYLDGFIGIPKPEGFTQKDKILPYMTIVYPKTGFYDIQLEDGPFQRLGPGAGLYITKPFQRHTIVHHTDPGSDTMQPMWLRLSVRYADGQDATGWFSPPLFITGAAAQPFIDVIDALAQDAQNHASYGQLYTGDDSPAQAFRKLEMAGKLLQLLLQVSDLQKLEDNDRILPALVLIREHFSEDLKICQLAQACGMSEATFFRVFRSLTNKTPLQYLLSFRLEQAARMLLGQKCTIGRIAQECGFCDEFHLSRSFKKHYGISPKEYRRTAGE